MNNINVEIWTFKQSPETPISTEQVHDIIVKYIKTGVILPKSKMPAYRLLAALNNTSRTTMSRIYKRLENAGWVYSVTRTGTYVSPYFPGSIQVYPAKRSIERLPVRLQSPAPMPTHNDHPPSDYISIGFDTPSPHYLSQWVYHTKITKHAQAHANFNQMDRINAMTNPQFNAAILDYLNKKRKFMVDADCLAVVLDRTQALQKVFKVLLNPCDVVVNTSPRDHALIKLLDQQGVYAHAMSSSSPGFIDELKSFLARTNIKALYLRPQCSHLEGHSMSDADCNELLELAKIHQFYIIEEDDYHELWYQIKPFKPLICRNHNGHVIYCGALSLLSDYLQQTRTIVAAAEFITLMQLNWIDHSPFKSASTEHAITLMLKNNKLLNNIKKMQTAKKNHRFEACVLLRNAFGSFIDVVEPSAGLSFWLEFPDAATLQDCLTYLQNKNFKIPIHPQTGRPNAAQRFVSFGFGTWDVLELQKAGTSLFEKLNSVYHDLA